MGATASGLCIVHCLATPILFVAQTCAVTGCCEATSPTWWSNIDYAFMGITFAAVFFSVRNTSRDWMKFALYGSWMFLSFLIINEKMALFPLEEAWTYGAASGLISLHLYNRKFCKCINADCSVN